MVAKSRSPSKLILLSAQFLAAIFDDGLLPRKIFVPPSAGVPIYFNLHIDFIAATVQFLAILINSEQLPAANDIIRHLEVGFYYVPTYAVDVKSPQVTDARRIICDDHQRALQNELDVCVPVCIMTDTSSATVKSGTASSQSVQCDENTSNLL